MEEEDSTVVFSLDADAITALTWTYSGETVSLSHKDGTWGYEDPDCPIDQSYPENMAYALEKITSDRTIEAPEDLSEYGLDEPQCTVDIAAGEDSYQLLIGDETTLDGLLYLSTGDGNVYLVSSGLLSAFSYGLYDIIDMEDIPSITDVSSFTIDRPLTAWSWCTGKTAALRTAVNTSGSSGMGRTTSPWAPTAWRTC